MAVLTWRNVDAPSGDSGLSGVLAASRMLGNAGSGIADALGNYGTAQTTLANNAFAQAASQYQDPNALKAALASGSLLGSLQGVDPSRVSASAIGAQDSRVGSLINDAANQQTLAKSQFDFGQQQKSQQLLDAATPTINALQVASATGDPQKLAAANSAAAQDPAYMALRASQMNGVLTDTQKLAGGQTSNAQSALGLQKDSQAYKDFQAGQTAAVEAMKDGTPEGAQRILNGRTDLTPAARMSAATILGQNGMGNAFAPVGSPGTGTPGTGTGAPGTPGSVGGNPYSAILGYGQYGKPLDAKGAPIDITTMKTGDVQEFGKTLIDKTRNNAELGLAGTGKGSSAMGAWQITNENREKYGPQLFGANWKDVPYNSDTQDKYAQAIYNDTKGGNLSDIWTSLKKVPGADKKGFFANVPWEQAKQLIAPGESQGNAFNLRTQQTNTANTVGALIDAASMKKNQNGANTIDPQQWASATGNDPNKAVADLAKTFPGTDPNFLLNKMKTIRDESNRIDPATKKPLGNQVSWNQAALILQNSMEGSQDGKLRDWWNSKGYLGPATRTADNRQFDNKTAQDLLDRYQTGGMIGDQVNSQISDQNIEGLKNFLATTQQADTALQQAQLASARGSRGVSAQTLLDLAAQAKQAHDNLDAMVNQVKNPAAGQLPNGIPVTTQLLQQAKKAEQQKAQVPPNIKYARKDNPLSMN
jgi:hypothetical protein